MTSGLRTFEQHAMSPGPPALPYFGEVQVDPGRPKIAEDRERGGLLNIARILLGDYKTVLLAMGVGLALALMVVLIKKPMYSAKTELLIESPNGDFLDTQAVNPVAVDPAEVSGLTDVETQLQVMKSDQLLDRVIAKLDSEGKLGPLDREASQQPIFERLLNWHQVTPGERAYRIHKILASHLEVRQVGPTRAVDVSYSSPDPGFAAEVCNTLASEYIAYNTEARWALSERTGEGLSRRLQEVRARLSDSQKNLQDYAQRSGLIFGPPVPGTTEETDVSDDRLKQLQDQLSNAEADRITAESKLKTAQTSNATSIADAISDDSLRVTQATITDLKRQRADLLAIYTPENEKVVRIDAQLTSLQRDFAKRLSEIQGRIRNDYSAAMRREGMLKTAYNQQVGVVTDKNSKAIQYGIYKQEVDSNQKLYESMLEQVNRVSVASAAGSSNIQVFSNAHPPERPNSSGVVTYSMAGLFFGFLAGSTLVLTRSAANRTFHTPGQSLAQVKLREIGVIPRCPISSLKETASKKKSMLSLSLSTSDPATKPLNERALIAAESHRVELACFLDKSSVISESFRMLLASIMFGDSAETRPKVIVLASANPREGKTTVLCNLAIAMSEIRQRILLIDGDLRRPRLTDVFGLPNNRGLRQILKNYSTEEPIENFAQRTFIRGIDLLPSGTADGNPEASLFYSTKLENVMQTVREKYDVVLIDTPPCLHLADARVIGRLADAVILVTRTGYTTWTEGRTVAKHFSEDGTRVLGTVLNDLKQSVSAYSYFSE